eukprot:6006118-Amphidinium_carterae.2
MHGVLRATAKRWSIVLYTPKHMKHLSDLDWQHLAHLGFPVQLAWERFGCHDGLGLGSPAKNLAQRCGELTKNAEREEGPCVALADQYWSEVEMASELNQEAVQRIVNAGTTLLEQASSFEAGMSQLRKSWCVKKGDHLAGVFDDQFEQTLPEDLL